MARLRQQHPQNYVNSGNIHTDFENLIRYINSAELGNKTVSELFAILFDEEGVFRGPIQMRLDSQTGIQYRVGQYNGEEDGWATIADIGDLRGPAGASVGNVEGPFFFNRQDIEIGGPVDTVTISAPGSGYTAAPTLTFGAPNDPNGIQATATVTLGGTNGDEVTAVTITNAGSGYSSVPTITFSGGNGTGAAAVATLGSPVSIVDYSFDPSTADIVVYRNGILLHEVTSAGTAAQYTYSTVNNTVTVQNVNPVLANGDKITVYSVRSQAVTNFRRDDQEITGTTTLISFVHTSDEKILVWRNGILQEEGGNADYLASATANTITFLDPNNPLGVNDKVTVLTVENQSLKTVAGLMFEDEYTDANGFIRYNKLSIDNDDIPQAKVSNLATSLAGKANITNSLTSPTSPSTGDLWLDISQVPAVLKFYDGVQWLSTSPESSLPTFVQSNAGQYVRVNGTGTSLEYGDIDFSSLVPKTYMGAANGVATLDTAGKLPVGQLPETFSTITLPFFSVWEDSSATVTNKTYYITRMWKQTIRIDGIAFKLAGGSCTIQLSVDGSVIGSTYSVSSTAQSISLATIIEIDATTSGRRLELVVTNASSATSLELGIAAATVNV